MEIVADSDGYKDYDEIEIKIKGPSLNSLSPNPTSGLVSVDYDVPDSSSAYLMVTNAVAASSNNYILDSLSFGHLKIISRFKGAVPARFLSCGKF